MYFWGKLFQKKANSLRLFAEPQRSWNGTKSVELEIVYAQYIIARDHQEVTFTFSHLADAFIQSDLQLGVHKAINLEEALHTEEVPITPSLRHCSNKYKLAREGEKDKDEDFEKVKVQFFILFFWSSVWIQYFQAF